MKRPKIISVLAWILAVYGGFSTIAAVAVALHEQELATWFLVFPTLFLLATGILMLKNNRYAPTLVWIVVAVILVSAFYKQGLLMIASPVVILGAWFATWYQKWMKSVIQPRTA